MGRNGKYIRDFRLRDGALPELENEVVQRICDEEETDGLIVVRPAKNPAADLMCDFRNPDGSRSFCGNGTLGHVCLC